MLFGKWSGTEVKIDGEELLIMKETDIMGILEGRSASKEALGLRLLAIDLPIPIRVLRRKRQWLPKT